nr:phenylglyoxylate dehydrogenase [Lachnospiraceae bacterium]
MIKVLSGNKAAAHAVRLVNPDVIAMYPITPQTPLAEEIAAFHADGLLDAEMIEVEGEHTAMSAVMSASVAGGRVFTSTSSWGLEYMGEMCMLCAGMRIPAVMVDVTRETSSIRGVCGSRQDIMSVRDYGWIQLEPANCQEILDTVLMAYRLSEDARILNPVLVAYDGFFLSHQYERVEIPTKEQVDRFLAPVAERHGTTFMKDKNLQFCPSISGLEFANYRYQSLQTLERVKSVFPEIEKEFEEIFGRSYGGAVDKYRTDDAEILFLTAGSAAGTIETVVDRARERGIKAGLARIKMFRPYPRQEMAALLDGRKAVATIDRSICLGWNCGHLHMEALAAVSDAAQKPLMLDFIDGIASTDITIDHIEKALAITRTALAGHEVQETNWLIWE